MNRKRFLDLLGPFPDRPQDRTVTTLEIADCGSYMRHRVAYNVEDNEPVHAYICIPKNSIQKVPGIFCHHQHNDQFDLGKSEVVGLGGHADQAYAAELAQRGYITFAVDALGFEERMWRVGSYTAEVYAATARLSEGKTLMAKLLHDISVGIDVLQGIDGVDADRIGFIGHSYGGKMAFWASAYDHRIKSAVSNGGSINLRRSIELDGILPELTIPGFLQYGDIADVAKLAAAKLHISGVIDDVWSDGVKELHDAIATDSKAAVTYALFEGVHGFSPAARQRAYDFFDTTV